MQGLAKRWFRFHQPLSSLRAGIDPDGYFRGRADCTEPFAITFPGLGPVYFTATVDGTREILSAPREGLCAPTPNPIEPIVGPNSVILTSGEHHRRTRQLLQPPFRGSQTETRVNGVAQSVIEEARTWQPGDRIRLHTVSQLITLRIIIRVVLGDTSEALSDHCMNVVRALMNANTAPLMLMPQLRKDFMGHGPWARLVRLRAEFDELIDSFVEQRRALPDIAGDDVLTHLLAESDESGTPLDYDDLRQQLRSLIAAGHDTTAAALAWALYYVHRLPEVRERVLAELADNPTPQEMAKLPYLSAVVSETLRMHPAVPIVLRRLREPRNIAGVERKPGDVIGIAIPALHFNPQLWPAPEEFRPERFLDGHPPPFGYVPFGGGYRRCIGAPFATVELAVAIGTLMSSVQLELPRAERRLRPPYSIPRGIAVVPRRDFKALVTSRHPVAGSPLGGPQ